MSVFQLSGVLKLRPEGQHRAAECNCEIGHKWNLFRFTDIIDVRTNVTDSGQ